MSVEGHEGLPAFVLSLYRKGLCELFVARAQHVRQEQMRRWDEENADREFKMLEVSFPWPSGMDGEAVFDRLSHDLPESSWEEMSCGWDEAGRTFQVTLFERGLEHRAGIMRLLADMGAVPIERVLWI